VAVVKKFEDLDTWQKARDLCRVIYDISSCGNFNKDYGLKDQIRRASVSVLSNISEGFERENNKEFILFLYYAKGSCGEVRTQLYVALDQKYISEEEFERVSNQTLELSRMISGFIKYLQNTPIKGSRFKV